MVQGVNGIKVGASVRPADRNSRATAMKSARVWPLSSFASTASSTDFHRAGNEQAARLAKARQQFAMLQQVLDLDGRVVGERGTLAMQGVRDAHSVRGPVEEIGIAEGDVLGARGHLLANVGEHHFRLHHAETALIYRHHGAMAAQMLAAAAGFGVAGALGFEPPTCRRGVFFERRKLGSQRHLELEPVERDQRLGLPAGSRAGQPLHQRNQSGFELAAQNGRDSQAPQVRFIQRRVQPVAA